MSVSMRKSVPHQKKRVRLSRAVVRGSKRLADRTSGLSTRLGEGMRAARLERKLTQVAAASRAGIPWRLWQRLEAGESNAQLRTLCRIGAGLAVDPADLFAPAPRRRRRR